MHTSMQTCSRGSTVFQTEGSILVNNDAGADTGANSRRRRCKACLTQFQSFSVWRGDNAGWRSCKGGWINEKNACGRGGGFVPLWPVREAVVYPFNYQCAQRYSKLTISLWPSILNGCAKNASQRSERTCLTHHHQSDPHTSGGYSLLYTSHQVWRVSGGLSAVFK